MGALSSVRSMAFTGAWCGGFFSYALAHHALTGDPTVVARISRKWAKGLCDGLGVTVHAHGQEHVHEGETYVFLANHQSHMDIPALFMALPVLPGFLAKKELRRVPLLGRAIEVGGHVFVQRGSRTSAVQAIDEAAAQVRSGKPIVVFPEGTRAATEVVKPFKKGGFHLAKAAQVPIVPIGIRGTGAVLRKHERAPRPGVVDVHIGEPISALTVRDTELNALVALVRGRICELAAMPRREDVEGPERASK